MITIEDKNLIELIRNVEELPNQYFWLRTVDFSKQLYISDKFKQVWSRPIEQLYESPIAFRDALVQEDETVLKRYHERANNSQENSNSILARLNTPKGEIHHLRDSCFGLHDSYGNMIGMAGVGKVITASEWEHDLQGQVRPSHPVDSILKSLREKHIYPSVPTIDQISIPCKKIGNKYFIQSLMGEVALTKRELECTQFLLSGKTAKETAKQLNLSPRTIEEYLDNVRLKLNCRNKIEIIGIINFKRD